MDTISRENNPSILPIASVIVGGLALILSIVALIQQGKIKASVTELGNRVTAAEESASSAASSARDAASKADRANSSLSTLAGQTQSGFNQITEQIAKLGERVTKLETTPVRAVTPKGDKAPKDGAAPTGGTQADGSYVVKSGDGLAKIAKSLGVSLQALEAANPGVDSRKLKVGQKLNVPKR